MRCTVFGPACLYALLRTSGLAADGSAGGVLSDLLSGLDQAINELPESLWLYSEVWNAPIHKTPCWSG